MKWSIIKMAENFHHQSDVKKPLPDWNRTLAPVREWGENNDKHDYDKRWKVSDAIC